VEVEYLIDIPIDYANNVGRRW